MKKNVISVLLTVLIASAAIIGASYALKGGFSSPDTPEKVTKDFYADWLAYNGNPLADKLYQNHEAVSDKFAAKVEQTVISFGKSGYDPVLCAQDRPEGLAVVNKSEKGDSAVLTIREKFSGKDKLLEVLLNRTDSHWQIRDVICKEGEREGRQAVVPGASPAIQDLVGNHIRNRISELSPKKEVLGGKFHVTSIEFISPTECIVDYEDGHIALTAQAEFTVPSADKVEIKSFELVHDYQEPGRNDNDFSEAGNIIGQDNDWQLVYEKPGQPALTADLEFGPQSSCFAGADQGLRPCLPPFWSSGDRVKVEGQVTDGTVAVSDLLFNNHGGSQSRKAPQSGNGMCEDMCGDGTCQEMVCMAEGCPCAETPESCPEDCKQ